MCNIQDKVRDPRQETRDTGISFTLRQEAQKMYKLFIV